MLQHEGTTNVTHTHLSVVSPDTQCRLRLHQNASRCQRTSSGKLETIFLCNRTWHWRHHRYVSTRRW